MLIADSYRLTGTFPLTETYGLTSQIRRAAVSIGANIAEGAGREGGKDRARFLEISIGSSNELEHHLIVASDLGFLRPVDLDPLLDEIGQIRQMLIALRARSLREI
ncbi:MAG: four helix bundle protein [Acidimicrobiia bacterium]